MVSSAAIPRHPSRHRFRASLLAGTALVSLSAAPPAPAAAPPTLPIGGQVTAGRASISQNGSAMTITQTTAKAILNWQGFDIGKQASVTFQQPDATAMALNRVTAGDASQIEGRLSANGQVVLVNPNGVVFGAGATVNAGGLVASTLDIRDADFQAGTMTFQRNGATGAVVNHGTITTARGGYAALIGARLANDGLLEARLGTVVLASGETAVLNFTGASLVGVQVRPSLVTSLIEVGGIIRVGGGRVLVTAAAADALLGGVINVGGVIEATSLTGTGGLIAIGDAGTNAVTVDSASRLDASARTRGDGGVVRVDSQATAFHGQAVARGGKNGGDGGQVESSGGKLDVSGARIDTAAPSGRRGGWLLDPADFVVDGSNNAAIQSGLASADVTIQTTVSGNTVTGSGGTNGANGGGNGDIVVAAPITWTSDQTLILTAYRSVLIQAPISASGDNAGLTVNTGGAGQFYTGSGGSVTLSGAAPSLTINRTGYTLLGTAAQLQAMGPAGNYALSRDIDLGSMPSFLPIGFTAAGNNALPTTVTGLLEGLGHTITHFVIDDATDNNLGLISSLGGTVRNLIIAGGGVTAGAGVSAIGMVAGQASGALDNVTASGFVGAGAGAGNVGGLIGLNNGTVSYGSFSGNVVAGAGAANLGGLVGRNSGAILGSYSRGSVTGGSGSGNIGGLVGYNSENVAASFSAANVAAGSAAGNLGGLVGSNDLGDISGSYATGHVVGGDGASNIGGLIGSNNYDVIVCYATGAVSAGASAVAIGGLVGVNTARIASAYASGAVAAGADPTSVGGLIGDNQSANVGQELGVGGTVNTLYWNRDSTGQGSAFGTTIPGKATTSPVGLTNATSTEFKSYQGFSTTLWFPGSDGTPALVNSPFVLQVTPGRQSATYGVAMSTLTAGISNFWPGDAINLVSGLVLSAGSGIGTHPMTASGAAAASLNGTPYQFVYGTGTLTLGKANLLVTAEDGSMTYGGSMPGLTAHYSGFVNGDGLSSLTTAASVTSWVPATAAAGVYQDALVVSGASAANYSITYQPGTLTINRAALLVTADDQGMTYGGMLPGLTVHYSGFVNGDTLSSLTTAASVSSLVPATAGAGIYQGSLVASGASAVNYSILYRPGTLTVNRAALVVTADDQAMTYGGAMPGLTARYDGFVNGDTLTSLTTAASVTALVPAGAGAGGYPGALVASGAQSGNYSITYQPGTLTINRAGLVVTADDQTMTYGGVMPGLTARYSGFVNGDTAAGLVRAAAVVSTVPETAGAGVYQGALVASGAGSPNYDITYGYGSLTIDRAPVSWAVADLRIPFGTQLLPAAAMLSGLIGMDRVTGLVGLVPDRTAVGSYSETVTGLAGPAAGNYLIAATGNRPGRLTVVADTTVPWPVLLGPADSRPPPPAPLPAADRPQLAEAAAEQILECQDLGPAGRAPCRIRGGGPAASAPGGAGQD